MKKFSLLLSCFLIVCNLSTAQNIEEAVNQFEQQTQATVTLNNQSGTPEFIRFSKNSPMSLQGETLQQKVQWFLESNVDLFPYKNIQDDFRFNAVKTDNYGFKSVSLNQLYQGVPIYDSQLKFHFNNENKLTAVNGNFIPVNKLNAVPQLSEHQAGTIALQEIDRQGINQSDIETFVFNAQLFVFQKGLVANYFTGQYLVYEVEIRNNNDVREFVFVNAHDGSIVQQFTGMAHALDRVVYEQNNFTTVWQEGDAFPGTLDIWQQNEVAASEHVYNFFNNAFGYVSYDNADAQMATINNNPNIDCPNANWNGATANFCTGTASDDVVAHEWGHAYTQYTSGLVYFYQSGALNESFSDIWGETIDLINNYEDGDDDVSLRSACNSSDRWMIGEDAAAFGGAIRDMWNPTCKGNPGKVTDVINYWCSEGDSGGVHINSGIPNHAYALLVDGGTYNGQTINGIGLTKAAHIFWRAQSEYLTQTSDFQVMADALQAACTDLTGIDLEGLSTTNMPVGASGEIIDTNDFNQLVNTLLAVEFESNPDSCNFQTVLQDTEEPCDASDSNPVFYEDWENGLGSWTVSQIPTEPNTWEDRDWEIVSTLPDGRPGQGVFGPDPVNGDCSTSLQNGILRLESPLMTMPDYPTGTFELMFKHHISTEVEWDGGNIKYSVDGGDWQLLPSTAFIANSYNGSLAPVFVGNDNPLAGEAAFTGYDEGTAFEGSWGRSSVDLSAIGVTANSTLQLRWEMGTDGCNGTIGWYLDDVAVYNCDNALSVNNEDVLDESLKVYPNPSNGDFNIKNTGSIALIKADIFDINGRLIKTVPLNDGQENHISLDQATSGVYFMKVSAQEGNKVIKLVVR